MKEIILLLAAGTFFGLSFGYLLFTWYKNEHYSISLPTNSIRTPEHLIAYQQTSVFTLPIVGTPTCFAVRNDTFIIGTKTPHALWFFDENGTLLQKIDLTEEPRALACGTAATIFSDNIVVAHTTRIAVYTHTGNIEAYWNLPDRHERRADVRSLALTSHYLFAACTGYRRVHRFTADGHFDLMFGHFTVYASPIVLTYSPKSDLLYVANPGKHRIEVFTQAGEYQQELTWGEPSTDYQGFAGCCNPVGLAVLKDGRIITAEKAVPRVKVFRDGKLDCFVAGPSLLDSLPPGAVRRAPLNPGRHFAVGVLNDGRISIFDFEHNAVRFFSD